MASAANFNWRNSALQANKEPARATRFLIFSALTASMGMMQFGYNISGLSSSQNSITCVRQPEDLSSLENNDVLNQLMHALSLPACIPMSTPAFSILNAIFSIGGLVGSLATSPLSNRMGKKRTILLLNGFLLAAPAIMVLAQDYWMLLVGRIIAGFGSGGSTAVIASYLSEISPPQLRGRFGSLTQIMLNVGLLMCGIATTVITDALYWRLILGLPFPVALLQVLLVPFISPSPRDVLAKKRVLITTVDGEVSFGLSMSRDDTSRTSDISSSGIQSIPRRGSLLAGNQSSAMGVREELEIARIKQSYRRQSILGTRRQSAQLQMGGLDISLNAGSDRWEFPRRNAVAASIVDSVFKRPYNVREEQASAILRKLWGENTDEDIIRRAIAKGKPKSLTSSLINKNNNAEAAKRRDLNKRKLSTSKPDENGNIPGDKVAKLQDDVVSISSSVWLRKRSGLLKVFRSKRSRYAVLNLILAHTALQASGINVYFAYSFQILQLLFSANIARLVFVSMIAYHIVAIMVSSVLLDRFGRRRLFMTAFVIMTISAALLTVGVQTHIPIISLLAFFGAVTGFATGMGNVPYVVIGEMVDSNAIASAAGAALTANWLTQFVYLVTFLPLLNTIGAYTFLIMAGLLIILGSLLFILFPETKNKPIDDVIDEMRDRFDYLKKLRNFSLRYRGKATYKEMPASQLTSFGTVVSHHHKLPIDGINQEQTTPLTTVTPTTPTTPIIPISFYESFAFDIAPNAEDDIIIRNIHEVSQSNSMARSSYYIQIFHEDDAPF